MGRDTGLDTLLDMDGYMLDQGDGYWVKIEVRLQVSPTKERPHGICYSLTLHDPQGRRVLGFDNAHASKPSKRKKYGGRRVEYDHQHRHQCDKGVPYEFVNPYQLLEDFFKAVDETLKARRKK